MANIAASLKNWSTTPASNQPDSTDAATLTGDLQNIQAGVRYLYSQDTIASATTCDLGSKDAGSLTISGTTTITGLGTVSAGIVKRVKFSGILILTYNATSLILPGAASITTAAGDTAELESLGSGNWRCNDYTKVDGTATVATVAPFIDSTALIKGSADATKLVRFEVDGLTAATTRVITVPDRDLTLSDQSTLATAQATTSGTSKDFTSIPSWVKEIVITFSGVSTNGTNNLLIQIGDSGGLETTGYLGSAWSTSAGSGVNDTTSFPITASLAAASIVHGSITLTLQDASTNTWVSSGNLGFSNSASVQISGGSKSLSATLDRVRITTSGATDTFDAGKVNILYK